MPSGRRAAGAERVEVKLYWFGLSHPAAAARKMLEAKGVEFQSIEVLPGTQRVHLRLAGFREGTVPAVKLHGRRVQGSLAISRALDEAFPEPPLFPAEEPARSAVAEAERWGERELQPAPRILIRWGLVHDLRLRRWLAENGGLPVPALSARTSGPVARYYARAIGADEAAVRRVLADLPGLLDRADELLAAGVLETSPPNAAALQVLSSVRALHSFTDLAELVGAHPVADAGAALFADFPGPVPGFLPREWRIESGATRP